MIRKCLLTKAILLSALVWTCMLVHPATTRAQAPADQAKPTYTIPEYNAFQAANAEKDPQARLKLLDDFGAKFPSSTLNPYVYQLYIKTYTDLKNYPKVIEYADKVVALGDKVDAGGKLQALQARCQVFPYAYNAKAPDATEQLNKERTAAQDGAKLLAAFPKPAGATMTDAQFEEQKKPGIAFFQNALGFACSQLKDSPCAISAFKAVLGLTPTDAIASYRLGVAYLEMKPPQALDGFWALGRAINLKISDSDKIKDYLRRQILAYEQPGCDSLADAQLNELLQLSANSPDRPATYTIPSADDLNKIRTSSNILTVLADLKAGGDKAKMTWLALCGAEFPEVVGKLIDITPGTDSVQLKLYTGATPEEIQAATTANLDVKVVGQPEASRLEKEQGVRFSGTLVGYDPDPNFMLHWDKAKVNAEDIPTEKGGAKKPVHKPATKKN
jgi:tetratricopeptide (TPR) repeat protein